MRVLQPLREEIGPVTRLAAPLALAELGWAAMGIVDTMMVGRLPEAAIAIGAVSLSTTIYYTIAVSCGAILLSLDTLVSQAFGARRLEDCHRTLWTGVYLCFALIPMVMALNFGAMALLPSFGVNPAILPGTIRYLRILVWSAPPLMLYFAFRRYLQGRGLVKPVMFALVSANLVNVAGNWVLIYGHLGAPAMGIEGSALSTVVARIYLISVLIGYAIWRERVDHAGLFRVRMTLDLERMRRMFALGGPAAAHVALEIFVFGAATALIAKLDPRSLAAHQIALNAASLSFMVPLGISSAAAVRVGHRIGALDFDGAARAGWTAIALGVAFMSCAALTFLLVPEAIARLYTPDRAVIETSVALLAVAAAFQLFDGLQIVAAGALRGAGDTRTPMLCNLIYYWFVGLPAGYVLCFNAGWGAVGLWTGLCIALILIGSTLLFVWRARVAHSAVRQTRAVAG
jgi:MATE family multidrug resistance protein